MRTILVPTDFSKTAENAMWYAAELAKKTKARIILLHVYQFPYISPEIPGTIVTFVEIQDNCVKQLKKLQEKISKKYGAKIKTDYAFRNGTVVDEINFCANKFKTDLVVIGIQGAGYLAQRLIGSTASALIRSCKYPVLTIGRNTRFTPPRSIALAYNYRPVKKATIDKLKAFGQIYKSLICIVHVSPDTNKFPNKEHMRESQRLEKILGDKSTVFYYVKDEDITNGLNKFLKQTKTQMIAMLPGNHTFLSRLFNDPYSKKMAFHTKVPLLTIHQ